MKILKLKPIKSKKNLITFVNFLKKKLQLFKPFLLRAALKSSFIFYFLKINKKLFNFYLRVKYGFRIYCIKDSYNPITLSSFIQQNLYKKVVLRDPCFYSADAPLFFNKKKIEEKRKKRFCAPEVYYTKINDGNILGFSNFIFYEKSKLAVHHDLFNPHEDSLPSIDKKKIYFSPIGDYHILKIPDNRFSINQALTFTDELSFNYAHWLGEVLPKIYLFVSNSNLKNIPIIVNSNLHKNIICSLKYLCQKNTKIIFLKENEAIHVKTLYVISTVGYLPYRKYNKPNDCEIFHHDIMIDFKNYMLNKLNLPKTKIFPKIYLKRKSLYRNIINEIEVENLLVKYGFKVLNTANLTFRDQVFYTSNCTQVISSTGAQLANLLFSSKKIKVLIIFSNAKGSLYSYWSSFLYLNSPKITLFIGNAKNKNDPHSDFTVRIKLLENFLLNT